MTYRPEIDGLRAIAILSVLIYHAGFDWLPGGFLGVDIFFVISGYLITRLILIDFSAGTFSYVQFYLRRAKRILPALLFVLMITLLLGYLVLLPTEYFDLSRSALSVVLFVSNIFFWTESGYFDGASQLKPLLHTWSLSLEEQYYILFPVLLSFLVVREKRTIVSILAIMTALSFGFSIMVRDIDPMANFYLLPSRAWQLLVGSLCAFVPHTLNPTNGKIALFGFTTLLFSVFTVNSSMNLPGYTTILPTLGTAAVIVFATSKNFVGKLLAHRLLILIGLISYSAYLWHQPIFALSRVYIAEELSTIMSCILLLVTALLSYFSWRFVERPFRRNDNFWGKNNNFIIILLVANSILLAMIISVQKSDGFQGRFEIPASVYQSLTRSEKTEECFDIKDIERTQKWNCVLGDTYATKAVVVFGDSHALAMLPAFDEAAKLTSTKIYFVGASGCTPLLGIHALRSDQKVRNCHNLNKLVLDFAEEENITSVFLIARWSYYTDGGYSGEELSFISKDPKGAKNKTASRESFSHGIKTTIQEYRSKGIEPVFIRQIPEQLENPLNLYAASKTRNMPIHLSSVLRVEHQKLQSFVEQQFFINDAFSLDFSDELCGDIHCSVGNPRRSFYFDSNHLSVTGAHLLIPSVVLALQNYSN